MPKSTKINDFRTLNLSNENTPTKKNVGVVSVKSNTTSKSVPKKKNKNVTSPKSKNVAKNESNEKEKRSGIGFAIFFIILILLGAFIGCLFTPTFDISEINIQDGVNVDKNQIMSRLDEIIGENILKVNLNSLEKTIKEFSPYIGKVELKRAFPNTINVTYVERKPYALIKYLESFVVMDKYGHVLEIKKENDMPELTIIYGIDAESYTPGEKLSDVAGLKYENVTYILETSYQNKFDYSIHEINYTDPENILMFVKELDVDIKYGEFENNVVSEKMNYLNGILKKLVGKKGNLDISSNNYLEKTIFTERY